MTYIQRVFRAFWKEACNLGRQRVWDVESVHKVSMGFLHHLGRTVRLDDRAYVQPEVEREFKASEEYQRYLDALSGVAKIQAGASPKAAGSGGEDGTEQAVVPPIEAKAGSNEPDATPTDPEVQRRPMRERVTAFLQRVQRETGKKVYRADLDRVMGYASRRDREMVENQHPRATRAAREHLERELAQSPEKFWQAAEKFRPQQKSA